MLVQQWAFLFMGFINQIFYFYFLFFKQISYISYRERYLQNRYAPIPERNKSILRRVGFLAIACILSLLCRAFLNLAQLQWSFIHSYWAIAFLYYTILEILPLFYMLCIVRISLSRAYSLLEEDLGPSNTGITSPLISQQ